MRSIYLILIAALAVAGCGASAPSERAANLGAQDVRYFLVVE
jgi:hypothetical protein